MCMECLQEPCHPRCPNAVPEVVATCDICDKGILEGEDMYVVDGITVCEDCIISKCKTTAAKGNGYV